MKLPLLAKFALVVAPFLVATSAFAAVSGVGTFTCDGTNYTVSSFDVEDTPFGGIVTVGVPLSVVDSSIPYVGTSIPSCTLIPSGAVSAALGGTSFTFTGLTIASAGVVTKGDTLDGKITFSFTKVSTTQSL